MHHKYLLVSFLILSFVTVFACNSVGTDSGLMPDNFWGSGENKDLPAAWESVCIPDSEKCGSAHFTANDDD